MDDTNRVLEQKALRNVRTLVDQLERTELARRRLQWYVLAALAVAMAAILGLILAAPPGKDPQAALVKSCEIDAFSDKSAEYIQGLRLANPDMPYRELKKIADKKRSQLMEEARTLCGSRGP